MYCPALVGSYFCLLLIICNECNKLHATHSLPSYCMPQRVGQHHIISCVEPCTATKFLHLLDNVDSALEAIRF